MTEHDWPPALTAAPSAQSKPLQSIPDSALVAARKTLEGKSGVDFLEGWVEFVAILRAAPPTAQVEPNADLRADFERECADTDKLLTALGLSPEHCRTDGGSLKLGMILEALEARDRLIRRESAHAEPQMVAPQDGMQFWLWKNGDHFLAFTHLYPCFTPGGDPMVLGEPVGRAVFRRSFHRSGRGNAIGPAQPELPKARSLTDELMDCVDRLGSEAKDVDPRVWDHLRVYMPAPQAAQAEPCQHDWRIWPETDGQTQRCSLCGKYRDTPEDAKFWKQKPSAQAEPQEPLDIAAIRAACRAEALEEAAQIAEEIEDQAWALWRAVADPYDQGRSMGAASVAQAILEMK